jgi:hypothetical protein
VIRLRGETKFAERLNRTALYFAVFCDARIKARSIEKRVHADINHRLTIDLSPRVSFPMVGCKGTGPISMFDRHLYEKNEPAICAVSLSYRAWIRDRSSIVLRSVPAQEINKCSPATAGSPRQVFEQVRFPGRYTRAQFRRSRIEPRIQKLSDDRYSIFMKPPSDRTDQIGAR